LKLRAPLLLSDQHQVDLGFGLGHDGSCARLLPKVVTAGSEGHAAQASRTPSVFPAPATAGATNFLFREGQSKMARLAGIEPTTLGFGGQYSIH
jgi:hypothetical protein